MGIKILNVNSRILGYTPSTFISFSCYFCCLIVVKYIFHSFSYLCIILSTLRRWGKSAAIQELSSFLGIGTKQCLFAWLWHKTDFSPTPTPTIRGGLETGSKPVLLLYALLLFFKIPLKRFSIKRYRF